MDINLRLYPLCFFILFSFADAGFANDVRLKLNADSRLSYDDNITYTHQNELHDLMTQFNFGVGLKAQGSRFSSDTILNLQENIYAHEEEFNHTAFDFKSDAVWDATSRDQFKWSEQFVMAEQPRTFADAFGVTQGRSRYDQNRFQLSGTHDLNSTLRINGQYRHNLRAYVRNDLSDSSEHIIGSSLQYAWDSAHRIGLGYDFTARDFSPGQTIQIQTVYAGYRQYLTKQLYVDLKAGEDFIQQKNHNRQSQSMGEIRITNDLDENTKAGFEYKKGIGTYSNSQNVFNSYQLSFNLLRQLTSRIYGGANGFYGEGEYQISQIHDRLFGVGIMAGYALTFNARVGFNYDYSETQSNVSARTYVKNMYQLGMQVTF